MKKLDAIDLRILAELQADGRLSNVALAKAVGLSPTPCAFVELKPGMPATEAELIAHCQSLLARFKAPKKVVFCELPKTSTGKIQKFLLRERAKSANAIE